MTVRVLTYLVNTSVRLSVSRFVGNSEEFGKNPRTPKMSGTDDLPISSSDAVSQSNRGLEGAA